MKIYDILPDLIPIIGFILFSTGLMITYGAGICLLVEGAILLIFGIFINMPKKKG